MNNLVLLTKEGNLTPWGIVATAFIIAIIHYFSHKDERDNFIERRASLYTEQAARNSWMLVTPAQKGNGIYTPSKIDNYLKWLNSKSGKNFTKEQDLRVKTVNLAQNINRVGETAFCIKQLIEDDRNFLRHNDKWYLLDSTLTWAEAIEQIMPHALKSKPIFFLNGREQESTCSRAIYTLRNAWDDEIKEHKKGDFYKTLVSIYGSDKAEFILRQLLLTNANYNYMKAELSELINN